MNLATAEIKAMLVEKYRRSPYARKAKDRIQELSTYVCIFYLSLHFININYKL